jgi:hypothetical protein
MPTVSQLPAQLDAECVAGDPFSIAVTSSGATITSPTVTLKNALGATITGTVPTVTQVGAVTTVSFSSSTTAGLNTNLTRPVSVLWSLSALVDGAGPFQLVARRLTIYPVGTAGVSSTSSATLAVTVGGAAVSLAVALGGVNGGVGAASDVTYSTRVTGDAFNRLEILADGTIKQGDGVTAPVLPVTDQQWAEDYAIETLLRVEAGSSAVPMEGTGNLIVSHFRANRNIQAGFFEIWTGDTAAVTTTTCIVGLFSVDIDGNLTKITETPNDTTLFAAANTKYRRKFTSTATLTAGTMYAFGVLVAASTMPTLVGMRVGSDAAGRSTPFMTARVDSQVAMPASATRSSMTTYTRSRVHASLFAGDPYLLTSGTTAEILTPDAAALDITGDIELVARISPTTWTPPTGNGGTIIAKEQTTTTRSFRWLLDTTGALTFSISANGSAISGVASSVTLPSIGAVNGQPLWVRVTRVVSTGVIQFFWATDQTNEPTVWTQLGTNLTNQTGVTTFSSTSQVSFGARLTGGFVGDLLSGRFHDAKIRNGVNGTVVFDLTPPPVALGNGQTYRAITGQTVTLLNGATAVPQ